MNEIQGSNYNGRAMTERARQLRRGQTLAENRVWQMVRGAGCGGVRFLRQVPAGQYVLDFYCASLRLAIEIDGPIHDVPDVHQRDRCRQATLEEELRLHVVRITNDEALTSTDEALRQRIEQAIEAARAKAPAWGERPARRR